MTVMKTFGANVLNCHENNEIKYLEKTCFFSLEIPLLPVWVAIRSTHLITLCRLSIHESDNCRKYANTLMGFESSRHELKLEPESHCFLNHSLTMRNLTGIQY